MILSRRSFPLAVGAAVQLATTRIRAEDAPAVSKLLAPDVFVVNPTAFAGTKAPRSIAYRWMDVALAATARDVLRHGARPTIGARVFCILTIVVYEAWAAYDPIAAGSVLGRELARPAEERTEANKEAAISHAAFAALCDLYPEERPFLIAAMRDLGYDPGRTSADARTPEGLGQRAAAAVLATRHDDGANQHGDDPRGNGDPYSDTSDYYPVNTPDHVTDPNHWQPIRFARRNGPGSFVLPCLTPHWGRVRPFALSGGGQFRPGPPPAAYSRESIEQADEVLHMSAGLTPDQKGLVEFMRDGPSSTAQAGHWMGFSQAVSRRDGYGLDQDVKLFLVTCATAMDAFIASWDAKMAYDSSRPWTLIHTYHGDDLVRAWGGPGKGAVTMPGREWRPYSPHFFITPPFPGLTSGHSTVSGGCAEALRLFTGSDEYGEEVIVNAGALTEPGERHSKVTLRFPTFTQTGEMAGISRLYGGYHIAADNRTGLALGRKVAQSVHDRCAAYFAGHMRI